MHDERFHDGEILVQERAGERALAARVGASIADAIVPGARSFLARQRLLAICSVDADETPWASLLFGEPGFASTADGTSVTIDLTRAAVDRRDALWSNLLPGAQLGVLAIDLRSRRRLRINGAVSAASEQVVEVAVREAYPNCPRHIQQRVFHGPGEAAAGRDPAAGRDLDEPRARLVERADTLFVASRHPDRGADVSHRGGVRGFVRVLDATTIRVPDYRGNGLFNTLGNLAVSSRAGLVIPDFERGRGLQLVGEVVLQLGVPEDPRQPTGGTGRYWDLHLSRWVELPLPARATLLEPSPVNPSPGTEAAAAPAAGSRIT